LPQTDPLDSNDEHLVSASFFLRSTSVLSSVNVPLTIPVVVVVQLHTQSFLQEIIDKEITKPSLKIKVPFS
jgi:hypothetical protein